MFKEISFRLTGTAPLLMHAARLADPTDSYAVALARLTGKKKKVLADHERISQLEWHGGLWLSGGRPCVPAEAIEAAIVGAAKTRRSGTLVKSAVTVRETPLLEYEGASDLDELFRDAAHVFRTGVRIGARTTIRTRPRFERWAVTVTVAFAPAMVSREDLREFVGLAGDFVGVGDWRPRFGRFRVETV